MKSIRNFSIRSASSELTNKIKTTTTPPMKCQFMQLSYIKKIKPSEDRDQLWSEFSKQWNQKNPDIEYNDDGTKKTKPTTKPSRKIQYHGNFSDKLNNFVTFNPYKLLTLEEFHNVSSGWPQTNKSIEE